MKTIFKNSNLQIELVQFDDGPKIICIDGVPFRVRQARQLARWLTRAADIQADYNYRFNFKIKKSRKKKRPVKKLPEVLPGQLAFESPEYKWDVATPEPSWTGDPI